MHVVEPARCRRPWLDLDLPGTRHPEAQGDGSAGQIAGRSPVSASTRRTDLLGCRTTRSLPAVRACSWAVSRNRTPAASIKVMSLKSRTICWMPASTCSSARRAAPADAMSSSPCSRMVELFLPLRWASARKPGASVRSYPLPSMPRPLDEAIVTISSVYHAGGLLRRPGSTGSAGDAANGLAAWSPFQPARQPPAVPVAWVRQPPALTQPEVIQELYMLSKSALIIWERGRISRR